MRDCFDVPDEIAKGPHSPAFSAFLWNWFADATALTHGELDLTFLQDLTPEEVATAGELIRRNLHLKQNHIIEGAAALHDVEAVPLLRSLLDGEPDLSRRLTIAGALWRLVRDPAFPQLLDEAKRSGLLIHYHLLQVLWLDDERALDFLVGLLPEGDRGPAPRSILSRIYASRAKTDAQKFGALTLLNRLEFGKDTEPEKQHPPSYYRRRAQELAFRDSMTAAIRRWNAEMKNGR